MSNLYDNEIDKIFEINDWKDLENIMHVLNIDIKYRICEEESIRYKCLYEQFSFLLEK